MSPRGVSFSLSPDNDGRRDRHAGRFVEERPVMSRRRWRPDLHHALSRSRLGAPPRVGARKRTLGGEGEGATMDQIRAG